jgi:cytochrome b561
MPLKNTQDSYGFLAKFFHWLLFLMLVGAIIAGNINEGLPDGPEKYEAITLHKAFGSLILMLVPARLGWKLANPTPAPATGVSASQHKLGTAMHWLLYVLMLAQPISGVLMSQSAGYPVSFFGLFDLPTILAKDKAVMQIFHTAHGVIWIALVIAALGHIGAALHHHFKLKDKTLTRMLKG